MPFKSQAQRRKFAQLLVEGKISPETFEEWNRETGARKLPERARATGTRRTKGTKTKGTKKTAKGTTKTAKGAKKRTKGTRARSR